MADRRAAFTLVELSIVLVILGLLIGGVLTGQSLIRAAELRAVTTQEQRYITAVQTFRDKYFALPGDMPNAQAYWGIQNSTPATCATTASTSALTCNGDGDGKILVSSGSNEYFRFWQHLANAGLIEGSYDGITHGASVYSATKANSASGRISSSLWFASYVGARAGDPSAFDGQYDNAFEFGGLYTDNDPWTAVLKPEDAYNIDTKMDDGKPATGRIVIRAFSGLPTCTTAASGATTNLSAAYNLTNTALACAFYFRQAF